MTKEEIINYWVVLSKEDYDTMEYLFTGGRYSYSLFVGHLALEKILKALIVKNNVENVLIPKIHNLLFLAVKANIEVPNGKKTKFQIISTFNIAARYDDYKRTFAAKCTKEWTLTQINNIKEVYEWLNQLLQMK